MLYSERLKAEKIDNQDSGAIYSVLDNFCTADDLIGVPSRVARKLFIEYCENEGIDLDVSYTKFGIAVCKKFGLKTISARVGDTVLRVYVRRV